MCQYTVARVVRVRQLVRASDARVRAAAAKGSACAWGDILRNMGKRRRDGEQDNSIVDADAANVPRKTRRRKKNKQGRPTAAVASSSLPIEDGWAPLADRLNPTRKAFDPCLKQRWATMSKKERKTLQRQDRETIAALKARGRLIQHAFTPDPNDHCETSAIAYRHIAPILQLVAAAHQKPPASLRIWDPYYCAGSVQRHLKALGFPLVHNVNEDFYAVIASGRIPEHDVLITNPPYTADHVERFLSFAVANRKPWFLLVPDYFANRPNYAPTLRSVRPFYLCPRERYHYWTPEGLRKGHNSNGHRNLALGRRNSPFVSYWHIHLGGALQRDGLLSKQPNELGLEKGVRLFDTATDVATARWGTSVADVDKE